MVFNEEGNSELIPGINELIEHIKELEKINKELKFENLQPLNFSLKILIFWSLQTNTTSFETFLTLLKI